MKNDLKSHFKTIEPISEQSSDEYWKVPSDEMMTTDSGIKIKSNEGNNSYDSGLGDSSSLERAIERPLASNDPGLFEFRSKVRFNFSVTSMLMTDVADQMCW